MKPHTVKIGFLVIGLAGTFMLSAQTASAKQSFDSKGGASIVTAVEEIKLIDSDFKAVREQAYEAAVSGSYRVAKQYFKDLKQLLTRERGIIEELIATSSSGDEMSMVRHLMNRNATRTDDVREMLKLLRVAVGGAW